MKPETRAAYQSIFEAAAATAEVSVGKTRRLALCRALVFVQALNAADEMNGDPPKLAQAERKILERMRELGIRCAQRGERRKRL